MAQRFLSTLEKQYTLADELLCEYVDGEVDPTVRAAFEECLGSDKPLAEKVECLRRTRQLLTQYRCGDADGLHLRVRARLLRQLQEIPKEHKNPLSTFLMAGTLTALLLGTSLIAGDEIPSLEQRTFAPPVPVLTEDVRMTPLPGPVPHLPVMIASGPPLLLPSVFSPDTAP